MKFLLFSQRRLPYWTLNVQRCITTIARCDWWALGFFGTTLRCWFGSAGSRSSFRKGTEDALSGILRGFGNCRAPSFTWYTMHFVQLSRCVLQIRFGKQSYLVLSPYLLSSMRMGMHIPIWPSCWASYPKRASIAQESLLGFTTPPPYRGRCGPTTCASLQDQPWIFRPAQYRWRHNQCNIACNSGLPYWFWPRLTFSAVDRFCTRPDFAVLNSFSGLRVSATASVAAEQPCSYSMKSSSANSIVSFRSGLPRKFWV